MLVEKQSPQRYLFAYKIYVWVLNKKRFIYCIVYKLKYTNSYGHEKKNKIMLESFLNYRKIYSK